MKQQFQTDTEDHQLNIDGDDNVADEI